MKHHSVRMYLSAVMLLCVGAETAENKDLYAKITSDVFWFVSTLVSILVIKTYYSFRCSMRFTYSTLLQVALTLSNTVNIGIEYFLKKLFVHYKDHYSSFMTHLFLSFGKCSCLAIVKCPRIKLK